MPMNADQSLTGFSLKINNFVNEVYFKCLRSVRARVIVFVVPTEIKK